MWRLTRSCAVSVVVMLGFAAAIPALASETVVLVLKDGHRQSLAMADVARIDFKAPATIVYKDGRREKISGEIDHIEFGADSMLPGHSHFIGKWQVGEGNGSNFYITLESDGSAKKSIGESHGTWTLMDGEARIAWDDGWHDIIRKVGNKHEKVAFEPNKSFSDPPANVTPARNMEPKPI
jgi:hypothetical protein